MPKMKLDPKNKAESPYDYPKLTLDKGERARIICIEKEPEFGFAHTLRSIVIVDDAPVMETVTNFGKTTEQAKTNFLGKFLCTGDYDTIADKGADPKNCPVCRAASESDAVKAPERRFAMHVIRYATKAGGFEVAEPFSVSTVAWAFGDRLFNTLTNYAVEWGDLLQHDLLLGPCESKQWQKFDVNIAGKAEWLASEERKKLVAETYKQNQSPDLMTLIGRSVSHETLEDELDKVLVNYRIAHGRRANEGMSSDEVADALDIDSILNPSESSTPSPVEEADAAVDADDVTEDPAAVADLIDNETPEAEQEGEQTETTGETVDLDDLLSELG
jgi:hypothetical protein